MPISDLGDILILTKFSSTKDSRSEKHPSALEVSAEHRYLGQNEQNGFVHVEVHRGIQKCIRFKSTDFGSWVYFAGVYDIWIDQIHALEVEDPKFGSQKKVFGLEMHREIQIASFSSADWSLGTIQVVTKISSTKDSRSEKHLSALEVSAKHRYLGQNGQNGFVHVEMHRDIQSCVLFKCRLVSWHHSGFNKN